MTTIKISQEKACKLTAAFEGAGGFSNITGNFDGQGLSFGFLQWNIGKGTLQPLILKMSAQAPHEFTHACTVFVKQHAELRNLSQDLLTMCKLDRISAVRWCQDRQDAGGRFKKEYSHWVDLFKNLGSNLILQNFQIEAAAYYLNRALADFQRLRFKTMRGYCLFFDIAVQNGGVRSSHVSAFRAEALSSSAHEPARMEALARSVTGKSNPRWQRDVLSRKMTIAKGFGIVHGKSYTLEKDFGITLEEIS